MRASFPALVLVLAGCGSNPSQPSRPEAESPPAGSPAESALVAREIVDNQGARRRVWIAPDRLTSVDTKDPCCGLSYDGNRYDDRIATCAPTAEAGWQECGPGRTAVYPGLADDRVCGERRRCVPLPEIRILISDDTVIDATDADQVPMSAGSDPAQVPYRGATFGREGFAVIRSKRGGVERAEWLAVDHGRRYTVFVGGGGVDRVTRD